MSALENIYLKLVFTLLHIVGNVHYLEQVRMNCVFRILLLVAMATESIDIFTVMSITHICELFPESS